MLVCEYLSLIVAVCFIGSTGIQSYDYPMSSTLNPKVQIDSPVINRSSSSHCSAGNPEGLCAIGLFCEKGHCKCGRYPYGIIECDEDKGTSAVLDCYCATFDELRNVTKIGACIYNCENVSTSFVDSVYHPLLNSTQKQEESVCGFFKRNGTLCGHCQHGFYALAYSFNLTCIPCSHVGWNWGRYIMAAYLPLTLFCFIILFFEVNAATSHLHPVIWYSQSISVPAMARILLLSVRTKSTYLMVVRLLLSVYGIWNLDFFRPFYSDLCLGIGFLPTLALDYVVAVYPLLLMALTYLLVNLYDQNYRVIVIIWKPFHIIFSFFKKNWNIRSSLIDSFATFFLLANVKFLSVTFDVLAPTRVYELHRGNYSSTWAVYYAGDVKYFGKEHLPYAILAIFVTLVFVILPFIILAFYPFTFFQKLLNCIPVRRHILRTFVDSFQGVYKDGTEPGTRDCRYFAALFFIMRFVFFLVYVVTLDSSFFSLSAMILLLLVLLIINVQPFKAPLSHYSKINSIFFTFLAMDLITMSALDLASIKTRQLITFLRIGIVCFGFVPLIYALIMIIHWIYSHRRFGLKLNNKIRARFYGYRELNGRETSNGGDYIDSMERIQ